MYDVITIGTATRDAFLESPAFVLEKDKKFTTGQRLSMPAGSKIEIPKITFTTGGGSTNAATTFARQGLATACVASVGHDVSGEEVSLGLKSEGINTRFLIRTKKYPTAYSILLLSGGERTILVYRGASEHLQARDIPLKKLQSRWFYIFPGGALGACKKALQYAKTHGIRTALNPSSVMLKRGAAYFKTILRFVDVLIMNREEASLITGIPYRNHAAIFKKIDEWMPCLAVLTDGPRGVMVSDGVNLYKAGVFKERKLVDRTGAGDAFGSGFVAGLIQSAISYKPRPKVGIPISLNQNNGASGLKAKSYRSGAVCDIYPPETVKYAIRLGSANATSVVEYVGAKEGILTGREFNQPRWKKLYITRKKL